MYSSRNWCGTEGKGTTEAWAPSSRYAEVRASHPTEDTHDTTPQSHSNWACPGRNGPMNWNYYETESADHVTGEHLPHMHSSSGHPKAPGTENAFFKGKKVNRTTLLAPGSRALKDKP